MQNFLPFRDSLIIPLRRSPEVVVVVAAAPRHAPHLGVVATLVRDGPDAEGAVRRRQDPPVGDERAAAERPICENSWCFVGCTMVPVDF